jgi:hypothetical protein
MPDTCGGKRNHPVKVVSYVEVLSHRPLDLTNGIEVAGTESSLLSSGVLTNASPFKYIPMVSDMFPALTYLSSLNLPNH